ncbi:hypothetical protein FOPG_12757 [Fusarium oxysporum f. sp. conglutinans race 2 54008]|uniref:Uncharacterized protein n=1 Tax=Fusarium oxysporum f. sp. conglutinans race 2 54008 TaxID=1089457 RepID=X0H5U5_FUSOX|nr:hypothetical protein FOPG_12757 [Fusarium oxysporum f. sp. conglutinans race 2 54008]
MFEKGGDGGQGYTHGQVEPGEDASQGYEEAMRGVQYHRRGLFNGLPSQDENDGLAYIPRTEWNLSL